MKTIFPEEVERGRVTSGRFASRPGDNEGAFVLRCYDGAPLFFKVIVGRGLGWDHVSVSTIRTPNWCEMCWIRDLFFEPEECVMQLHPPKSQYINRHPHVLHLWRPHRVAIPMPPKELV